MENKTIKCKICGNDFCFSVKEQEYYNDRLLAEPRRCPTCRAARKADLDKRREVIDGKLLSGT